ncbi:MAG: hypothetical protein N2Z84_01865 [Atribacterota bacterium]|nr:hypothetical protein [Atribacterota bacterium]
MKRKDAGESKDTTFEIATVSRNSGYCVVWEKMYRELVGAKGCNPNFF